MDIEEIKKAFTLGLKGVHKTIIPKGQLEYLPRFETRWEYSFGLYYLGRAIVIVYYCQLESVWSYVEVLDPILGIYDRKEIFKHRWEDRTYMKDITSEENGDQAYWVKVMLQLLKEHGYEIEGLEIGD